jgi:nicotinamide-nucleotide amidase
MNVHILAVGSELLTPFFRDTNSLYLTERLNDLGLEVVFKGIVGDEIAPLTSAIRRSLASAALIFLTGGLGPTGDDRTREAVASVLGRKLHLRDDILGRIEERFRRRGKIMPEANRRQAFVLEGAEVLDNANGTAPGQWVVDRETTIIMLPGPPFELRAMCENAVWPRLAASRRGFLARIVLKTTGLTESEIESRIADLYPEEDGRRLTILASPGQIELHLSAFSGTSAEDAKKALEEPSRELHSRLEKRVISADGAELEEVVGGLLRSRGETVATAESCTGGLVGHRLTSVPGSSAYFLEGFITYANRSKIERLGVSEDIIRAHGAVSAEVAAAMAEGVRAAARTDFGLGITGIAGPGGGTEAKPVGLVFTALAREGGTDIEKNIFPGPRDRVKILAAQKALDMLRLRLLQGDSG